MARPRIYTNAEMIAALSKTHGMIYMAARLVGCDPETIANRAKRSPDVAKCIRQHRGEVVDKAESKLVEAIEKGEAWAVALVLKTRGAKRGYVERKQVQHSGELRIVVKERVIPSREHHRENGRSLPAPS